MVRRVLVIVVLALAAVALWYGNQKLGFVCDDAFIAFRYVANRHAGRGLVFNPAPFRPVEGYTSFLWVAMLDGIWTIASVEPPDAAKWLGLACGFASVGLVAAMAMRMRMSPALGRFRVAVLALALLGTLSNRTFLAWTSSGLEAPLFVALVLAWVYATVFANEGRKTDVARVACASALALCRPEGVLFVAASVVQVRPCGRSPRTWIALLPIAAPLAHLAWRRSFYGAWLPNTYYAKVVEAWPDAGAVYAASFILEYAYWIWIALAIAVLVRVARGPLARVWTERRGYVLAAGALVAHFAYYTFVIGGDHFEFRVYAHLVPLVALSLPRLCDALGWTPRRTLAVSAVAIALGAPIPWAHYADARTDNDWRTLHAHAVAPLWPKPLALYARPWDATQAWMRERLIGVRLNEHKAFVRYMRAQLPTRAEGSRATWDGFPIAGVGSVGLAGWVLPNVAIIDLRGLNDRVIARAPPIAIEGKPRAMAHDRAPPPGYLDCFRPNVGSGPQGIVIVPRPLPMTAAEIVACETRFANAR